MWQTAEDKARAWGYENIVKLLKNGELLAFTYAF